MWRLLAALSIVIGLAGVLLPVLPTVPFLLLAAWAAGKGSPRMERWLLEHERFGPPIRRWRERRAVPRSAKWAATIGMSTSALWTVLAFEPPALKIAVSLVLLAIGVWLWRRPEA
jgi:hypothetical protein